MGLWVISWPTVEEEGGKGVGGNSESVDDWLRGALCAVHATVL
jgi:hypothetical protein